MSGGGSDNGADGIGIDDAIDTYGGNLGDPMGAEANAAPGDVHESDGPSYAEINRMADAVKAMAPYTDPKDQKARAAYDEAFNNALNPGFFDLSLFENPITRNNYTVGDALLAGLGFVSPVFGAVSLAGNALNALGAVPSTDDTPGHPGYDDTMNGDGALLPVRQAATPAQAPAPTAAAVPVVNAAGPRIYSTDLADAYYRPSTLNYAPANAPANYSLLYAPQELAFQSSYALRPDYYSGQLDLTGYRPLTGLIA